MMQMAALGNDLVDALGMFQSDSGKWLCGTLKDDIVHSTSRN